MTMKERLETAINGIRANSKIPALDEAGVRTQVIDRLLERLGWEIFDENEFRREYPVPGGRVDYALLDNGDPKVFIEAKGPTEQLGHHEDQLVTYSAKRGVPLATLTNGLEWWLYLPLQVGSFEARRFCRLDICNQDVSEVCDLLIEFLARENVYSGAAVENAEAHLRRLQDARKVDKALPRVWEEFLDGPDDQLVELINKKMKDKFRVEATPERIKGFLVELGKSAPIYKQRAVRTDSATYVPAPKRPITRRTGVKAGGYGGKRIKSFIVFGEQFHPRSWKKMVAEVANQVYLRDPLQFHRQAPELRGTTREYFSRDPEQLEQPQAVGDSGWFVYTKWDPDRSVAVCRKLLELFGYNRDDLRIDMS